MPEGGNVLYKDIWTAQINSPFFPSALLTAIAFRTDYLVVVNTSLQAAHQSQHTESTSSHILYFLLLSSANVASTNNSAQLRRQSTFVVSRHPHRLSLSKSPGLSTTSSQTRCLLVTLTLAPSPFLALDNNTVTRYQTSSGELSPSSHTGAIQIHFHPWTCQVIIEVLSSYSHYTPCVDPSCTHYSSH